MEYTLNPLESHWQKNAERWRLQESPGRPNAEDVAFYEDAVTQWREGSRSASPLALVLGVTPEIALMRWPAGIRVVAADQSWGMIRGVWPGASRGFPAACARWTALPFRDASTDVAIGDGCFSSLSGAAYKVMAQSIRRVLRADGVLVMRYFNRPERPEPVPEVFADLFAGRIGSFFAAKWRLAMALHGTLDEGVRLGDVWDAWHAAVPEPDRLAKRLDWSLDKILMMDLYRDSGIRFTFPTLAEARAALQGDFEEIACRFPGYELGERCPTLVLRPRGGRGAGR